MGTLALMMTYARDESRELNRQLHSDFCMHGHAISSVTRVKVEVNLSEMMSGLTITKKSY